MTFIDIRTEQPSVVALLVASTICILLPGVYLIAAMFDISFALPISPPILAAVAVVFAVAAMTIRTD